jgi:hypothetical protein
VLDIAPLIMVTLPTVSSFFSTCGCFLRGGRSPSGDLPPLSIACGWPPSANDPPICEWRHLQGFRVEDPSGARKGGGGGGQPNPAVGWAGRPSCADRPRPISARFGRPFAPMGPQVIMNFAPSTCMILMMSSSRPRWRFSMHEVRSFTLQSPGVFLRSTSVLVPIGSDFIKLMNTTRLCKCSFELVVNPSFMFMFSYINTTLPNDAHRSTCYMISLPIGDLVP